MTDIQFGLMLRAQFPAGTCWRRKCSRECGEPENVALAADDAGPLS
jgi:hypothetical protein